MDFLYRKLMVLIIDFKNFLCICYEDKHVSSLQKLQKLITLSPPRPRHIWLFTKGYTIEPYILDIGRDPYTWCFQTSGWQLNDMLIIFQERQFDKKCFCQLKKNATVLLFRNHWFFKIILFQENQRSRSYFLLMRVFYWL